MTGATLVTMVPLGMASATGGVARDARAKVFRDASTTQLQAFGGTEEAIAAIHAADGLSSLDTAIEHFMATRDPNSGTARAAVEQLNALHEAQYQAARDLETSGILPRAVQHSDGSFTLYDTTTGEEIGTAPDWESATRVATTHANMVEERDSDRIAALPEKLQSDSRSEENQPAAELSPEQVGRRISQVVQQSRAQEQVRGGSGKISDVVNGRNSKEQRRNIRKAVQQLGNGTDIATTFREVFRANRRRAHAAGLISQKDEVAFLRAYEKASARRNSQSGVTRSLLPDNFDTLSKKEQSVIVEKAMTGIAEVEILRSRGRTTDAAAPSYSQGGLSAVARVAPEAAIKATSLINAARDQWGLSLETAIELKNQEFPEEGRNGGQEVKLDKLLGRDSRVPALRLTPSSFRSAILKLIGKDQLRTVQPNVSYEDKLKLIDDFSHGVLREGPSSESPDNTSPDEESRDWDYSTPDIGQPGGIQVLEQRLANDLLVDTHVHFLGETIQSAEDLAVKAMAIRNPMFETFYLFALKPDPNSDPAEQRMIVADVMAISSRVPCATNAFIRSSEAGGPIQQHMDFLDASGAKDFVYLHNHPSGDPTPSHEDIEMTKEIAPLLRDAGYSFHGHIVINHKKFSTIDEAGKADFIVEVSGKDGLPGYVSALDKHLYEKTPDFFGG